MRIFIMTVAVAIVMSCQKIPQLHTPQLHTPQLPVPNNTRSAVDTAKKGLKTVKEGVEVYEKASEELDERQEHYVGRAVAAQIFAKYPLHSDTELRQYVNLVLQTLVLHCDRPETYGGYHLAVVETDVVNAFAAPGGFVFVTTGLLKAVENEDELAAVLGHEVAHVVKRHGVKAIEDSRFNSAVGGFILKKAGEFSPRELAEATKIFTESIGDVVKTVLESGYSQDAELEADREGVVYCARAGYAPDAALTLLERTVGKGEAGNFSTHPGGKERVSRVSQIIEGRRAPVDPKRTARFQLMRARIAH